MRDRASEKFEINNLWIPGLVLRTIPE